MNCKLMPGQHVLCVENELPHPSMRSAVRLPEVGTVYTVARITIGDLNEMPCIVLEEIGEQDAVWEINGVNYLCNVLFDARCFKPLNPLKVNDFLGDLVRA